MESIIADIRDLDNLKAVIAHFQPQIIVHMAAQSLVQQSYDTPVETYAVNVMGTVNLLEAVRCCPSARAVVCITTDKCYENRETDRDYAEEDHLGGYDPYSSSKAAAEIVIWVAESTLTMVAPVGRPVPLTVHPTTSPLV